MIELNSDLKPRNSLLDDYYESCRTGDLEKVKTACAEGGDLLTVSQKNFGFRLACKYGNLDVIRHLLYGDGTFEQVEKLELHYGFSLAYENGNLGIIRKLLTSQALQPFINLHINVYFGFNIACENGHLDVIDYLLTSDELSEHADVHMREDYAFKRFYETRRFDILNYLVYDYCIRETKRISDFSKGKPELVEMFEKRNFKTKLRLISQSFACDRLCKV